MRLIQALAVVRADRRAQQRILAATVAGIRFSNNFTSPGGRMCGIGIILPTEGEIPN